MSLSADGLTATFNPNVDLANSTLYTATITTGAKDAKQCHGRQFRLELYHGCNAGYDTADGKFNESANNATGVRVTSNLTATFSERWTPPQSQYHIYRKRGSRSGESLSRWSDATFNPNVDLANSTLYRNDYGRGGMRTQCNGRQFRLELYHGCNGAN
ncbi:hypothetical protein BPIT_22810 [Candidatus Brocadia pituitae]|nr:hypothetical protein BPIT_22810 [Candidatus Brocadia pituitae]